MSVESETSALLEQLLERIGDAASLLPTNIPEFEATRSTLDAFLASVQRETEESAAILWEILDRATARSPTTAWCLARLGALEPLLNAFTQARANGDVAAILARVVGACATSVSVRALANLLSLLHRTHAGYSGPHALLLLRTLKGVFESPTQGVFFHFPGNGAGLVLPPIRRWAGQTSFSLSLWLRFEQLGLPSDVPVGDRLPEPTVFCFRTSKNEVRVDGRVVTDSCVASLRHRAETQ